MADDFSGLAGTNRIADVVRHLASTYQPSKIFTFEIELYILGFAFTGEASLADGLNLADTMTGMIDAIT